MKTRIIGLLFLVSLLVFTLLNFSNCNPANGDSVQIETQSEPTIEYRIVTDSFKVIKGLIKPGQVLGEILYLNHIDHPEIDQIVKKSKGIFAAFFACSVKNLYFQLR